MRGGCEPAYQNEGRIAPPSGFKESQPVSLYSMVSRGVAGRLSLRQLGQTRPDEPRAASLVVRFPGASMRLLEAGLALGAIATAILIGAGR
jgi:hypothetical protein